MEPNFYDHRLRLDEDRIPVFLNIFLNPFRKNLILINQKWPGYYFAEEDWNWFGPLTNDSCPAPEWLR